MADAMGGGVGDEDGIGSVHSDAGPAAAADGAAAATEAEAAAARKQQEVLKAVTAYANAAVQGFVGNTGNLAAGSNSDIAAFRGLDMATAKKAGADRVYVPLASAYVTLACALRVEGAVTRGDPPEDVDSAVSILPNVGGGALWVTAPFRMVPDLGDGRATPGAVWGYASAATKACLRQVKVNKVSAKALKKAKAAGTTALGTVSMARNTDLYKAIHEGGALHNWALGVFAAVNLDVLAASMKERDVSDLLPITQAVYSELMKPLGDDSIDKDAPNHTPTNKYGLYITAFLKAAAVATTAMYENEADIAAEDEDGDAELPVPTVIEAYDCVSRTLQFAIDDLTHAMGPTNLWAWGVTQLSVATTDADGNTTVSPADVPVDMRELVDDGSVPYDAVKRIVFTQAVALTFAEMVTMEEVVRVSDSWGGANALPLQLLTVDGENGNLASDWAKDCMFVAPAGGGAAEAAGASDSKDGDDGDDGTDAAGTSGSSSGEDEDEDSKAAAAKAAAAKAAAAKKEKKKKKKKKSSHKKKKSGRDRVFNTDIGVGNSRALVGAFPMVVGAVGPTSKGVPTAVDGFIAAVVDIGVHFVKAKAEEEARSAGEGAAAIAAAKKEAGVLALNGAFTVFSPAIVQLVQTTLAALRIGDPALPCTDEKYSNAFRAYTGAACARVALNQKIVKDKPTEAELDGMRTSLKDWFGDAGAGYKATCVPWASSIVDSGFAMTSELQAALGAIRTVAVADALVVALLDENDSPIDAFSFMAHRTGFAGAVSDIRKFMAAATHTPRCLSPTVLDALRTAMAIAASTDVQSALVGAGASADTPIEDVLRGIANIIQNELVALRSDQRTSVSGCSGMQAWPSAGAGAGAGAGACAGANYGMTMAAAAMPVPMSMPRSAAPARAARGMLPINDIYNAIVGQNEESLEKSNNPAGRAAAVSKALTVLTTTVGDMVWNYDHDQVAARGYAAFQGRHQTAEFAEQAPVGGFAHPAFQCLSDMRPRRTSWNGGEDDVVAESATGSGGVDTDAGEAGEAGGAGEAGKAGKTDDEAGEAGKAGGAATDDEADEPVAPVAGASAGDTGSVGGEDTQSMRMRAGNRFMAAPTAESFSMFV